MQLPGTQLELLCKGALREVVLVAPFIKEATFLRLLTCIKPDVEVKCITRWRPDEIAMGVSDLEVWTLINNRPNSSLWLRPDLHAKFYRADSKCLVGSANLTDAALGWSQHSNLELLLPLPCDNSDLRDFELNLLAGCVAVDDALYDYMRRAVERFESNLYPFHKVITEVFVPMKDMQIVVTPPSAWLPTLRHPENFYIAYMGNWNRLTSTAQAAAITDLSALSIPVGLSQEDFEVYVGAMILQKPVIQQVDKFIAEPQRFGAVRSFLKQLPCGLDNDFSPDEAWQTLMRWLLYFLPARYEYKVYRHSEVIWRKQLV